MNDESPLETEEPEGVVVPHPPPIGANLRRGIENKRTSLVRYSL
jgi:hypothetical protein